MTGAGRNLRTIGVMFAVAGLLGLLFSLVVPSFARAAASNHGLEIDLGNGFTTDPHGTVVDTSRLAPGLTVSGTFGVRSDYAGDSDLDLKFVDVRAQNGCAAVSSGDPCPQGPGNLRDELIFDVAVGDSRDGPFTSAWSGFADGLENDVSIPGTVHESRPCWVRISATLPHSAGNESENDQFGFGLRVTLTNSSGAEGLTVKKEPPRTGRLALAATGASIALFGIAALALIACGVIALLTGRSSRAMRRSAASDEAEHRAE